MIRARTLVLAVSLAVVALTMPAFFRSTESLAQPALREPHVVSFRVQLVPNEIAVVGTVPEGRRLLLKDFMRARIGFSEHLEIFADETIVAEIPPSYTNNGDVINAHLSAGIVIEGGQRLGVRQSSLSVPTFVTIAGVLE